MLTRLDDQPEVVAYYTKIAPHIEGNNHAEAYKASVRLSASIRRCMSRAECTQASVELIIEGGINNLEK